MFLLFALSVTPKQWLHDSITGHKHNYAIVDGNEHYQTSKSSFQCNWDNQAFESPFTYQPGLQYEYPLIAHSAYFNHYILSEYSTGIFFSSLRGPPALA